MAIQSFKTSLLIIDKKVILFTSELQKNFERDIELHSPKIIQSRKVCEKIMVIVLELHALVT